MLTTIFILNAQYAKRTAKLLELPAVTPIAMQQLSPVVGTLRKGRLSRSLIATKVNFLKLHLL